MTAPVVLAGLWGLSTIAFAWVLWHDVIRPERRARKLEEQEAAAKRLVEMRRRTARDQERDLDDFIWAEIETGWLAMVNSLPVLPYDPERLGGAS